MEELGRRIRPGEEAAVAETVKALMANAADRGARIRELREKNAVNFGHAGTAVADQLMAMEAELSGADRA